MYKPQQFKHDKRLFIEAVAIYLSPLRFFNDFILTCVTLAKGISKSTLNGLLTGSLLAATTLLWLNFSNALILPVLVALWWLVIFGCNLLHAYNLSNYKFSNTKRFGLQVLHAGVAAAMYWVVDYAASGEVAPAIVQTESSPKILQAGLIPNVYDLLSNTTLIVPAAFILSLVTSGLLFSILTRPSAK